MIRIKHIKFLLIIMWSVFFVACSNMKYLPDNESLYVGADVIVEPQNTTGRKNIRSELEEVIRPEPNSSFLGLRPSLWFYNVAGENANKGIRKWIKNKLGEAPVLLSQVDPHLIEELIINRLQNNGYFKGEATHEIVEKNNKAEVKYTVTVNKPYIFNEIKYPSGNDSLSAAIRRMQNKSLVYTGLQYNLDILRDERSRIDSELKNLGYYFFNPDFLVFVADTTVGEKRINIALNIKPDVPEKALLKYRFDKIFVMPQYSLGRRRAQTARRTSDTTYFNNYYFVERVNNFRHKILSRYIKIEEGSLYSKRDHDLTISRLMSMGTFKFVNIAYTDTVIDNEGKLDARINLTQLLPKTLKVDLEIGSKSNNYTGPSLITSLTNRNTWKGGELLKFSINGAYELQLSGKSKGFNSWEFGTGIQLITPRFIAPFKVSDASSVHIPKTKFDLQLKTLHRVEYYDMNGLNFTAGYIWRSTNTEEFEVNPIAINYSKLRNTTDTFNLLLDRNPYLRRTFEEQFTLGSTASYTLNTMAELPQKHQYYLNVMADVSGNLASLAHRISTGEKSTDERPYEILGSRYSQYSKLTTDFRYYLNFDDNNTLATRLMAGAGIPYGNSFVMPYSKQYFSGGSNSIRAFLPRSLGPGSYDVNEDDLTGYFDQSGDIKLEFSAEFRFAIISVLKGAVFTDIGNVWLARDSEYLTGGEFTKNFINELAVGSGLGLRIDLSFFLLRFDLGIPLRKPYLPEKERWVIDEIDFSSGAWRRDNLVINIAVGYPF